MATGLSPIVVDIGIQAGSPFVDGDVIYVAQSTPPITVRSTPNIFVDTTKTPQQIQIGPITTIPGATVIGSGATATAGGVGSQVVIGTNATTVSTQDDVIIGHGANAPVVNNGGVAIGAGATVGQGAFVGGVAIGSDAVAGNGVAIGPSAVCSSGEGEVAIGFSATAADLAIAIGSSANAALGGAHGDGSIAIGRSASAGESTDIAIGTGSGATAAGAGGNILLASGVGGAGVTGHDCVVIGSSSNNGGASAPAASSGNFSTVIGGNSTAAHAGVHIFGRGITSTANNQCVLGGTDDPVATVYIGNGITNAVPQNVVVGGTGGSGLNIAGAQVTIAGGIATGDAAGGSILFQTSVVAASSSTPQALATALTIDNTQTCTFAEPPVVPTIAGAAGAGTLANLPTGATNGNPTLYLKFNVGGVVYAVPAWST
jgi:hypothetical protein